MHQQPSFPDRVHGCLLGGALADARGYVQGDSSLFSDETQLTLFTTDGLLDALRWANDGVPANENACLWLAYLRWLRTQDTDCGEPGPVPPPEWLEEQAEMQHHRQPDEACLTGLATGEMGTAARPVNPDARGFGAVVRSAPFGLLPYVGSETAYKLSSDAAALTHGHPAARQSAAALSWMIHQITHDGATLASAGVSVAARLRQERAPEPSVLQQLERALDLGSQPGYAGPSPAEPRLTGQGLTQELGTGECAGEALAIGLYAALATESVAATDPAEHFRAAVELSTGHRGKTDSTGSVTGNLLGALYGQQALVPQWLAALQGRDLIRTMAASLVKATSGE